MGTMSARYVHMCDDEVCAFIVYSQRLQFGGLLYVTIVGEFLR